MKGNDNRGLPAVILVGGDSKEKALPSADWLMTKALFIISLMQTSLHRS
jgi:hypothetical protein